LILDVLKGLDRVFGLCRVRFAIPWSFSSCFSFSFTWPLGFVLVALSASMSAWAQKDSRPLQIPNTMAQRVQACTGCHGKEGRATNAGYFPRIAGKPAGYLYNQLINFREKRRYNPAMTSLLENLSDAYLRDMAEYFGALNLPYPSAQTLGASRAELERGETLIRRGDSVQKILACDQCHGASLTGMLPAVPGLLGLSKDYLIAQLGSWQTGKRHAGSPDCMETIARRLSPDDVGALTTWLSSQNLPATTKPASALSAAQVSALALPCGSGLQ
jgi:cytochrome c553